MSIFSRNAQYSIKNRTNSEEEKVQTMETVENPKSKITSKIATLVKDDKYTKDETFDKFTEHEDFDFD